MMIESIIDGTNFPI